jgi:uncharacterized protein (TIGR02757 family)
VDAIRERLDTLLARSDSESARKRDPVDFVHHYKRPRDQEIAGLVAASLAFGNAMAARKSVARALESLGSAPSEVVLRGDHASLERRLRGFVHRIYRGEHLASMLFQAGELLRRHGTLGSAFSVFHCESKTDFREALARFADALRGDATSRSARHLISDPRAGSACKRLLLYARWMIRPADGVDLGLWPISPSELVIPVDTHIHRISRNLGLTDRKTASWATAEEITASLRRFDPHDPVKYDFALCHLGVSRECPSRPQPEKCLRCVLQDVCQVWCGGSGASAKEPGELRL